MSEQLYSIYALVHPQTENVCYIGLSKNPEQRHRQHLASSANWIRELAKIGLKPSQILLEEELTLEQARTREKYWIYCYEGWGCPLENIAFNENTRNWREEEKETRLALVKRFSHLPELEAKRIISLTVQGRDRVGIVAWEDTYAIVCATIDLLKTSSKLITPISEIEAAKMTFDLFGEKWDSWESEELS